MMYCFFIFSKHLIAPHDIAVSKNGREIYVGELASSPVHALHKFELATRKGKIMFLLLCKNITCFDDVQYMFRSSDSNI